MQLLKPPSINPGQHHTTAREIKAAARTDPQDRLDGTGLGTRASNAVRRIIEAYPTPENIRGWAESHEGDWRGMLERLGGRKTRAEALAFFASLGYHETELDLSTRAKNALRRAIGAYPSLEKVRRWMDAHGQDWRDRLRWQCGKKTHGEIGEFLTGEGIISGPRNAKDGELKSIPSLSSS